MAQYFSTSLKLSIWPSQLPATCRFQNAGAAGQTQCHKPPKKAEMSGKQHLQMVVVYGIGICLVRPHEHHWKPLDPLANWVLSRFRAWKASSSIASSASFRRPVAWTRAATSIPCRSSWSTNVATWKWSSTHFNLWSACFQRFPPSHFNNLGYNVGKALVNHPQVITIFMVCYMFIYVYHHQSCWLWPYGPCIEIHRTSILQRSPVYWAAPCSRPKNLAAGLVHPRPRARTAHHRAGKSWDDPGKDPAILSHGKWMKMGVELQMFIGNMAKKHEKTWWCQRELTHLCQIAEGDIPLHYLAAEARWEWCLESS